MTTHENNKLMNLGHKENLNSPIDIGYLRRVPEHNLSGKDSRSGEAHSGILPGGMTSANVCYLGRTTPTHNGRRYHVKE